MLLAVGLTLLIAGILLRPETPYVTELAPQQAESVTELYFDNHSQLPQRYRPGEKQEIRFTVRNTGTDDSSNQYEVLQHDASGMTSRTLTTGVVNVKGNSSHTETVNITYVDAGASSTITVRLVNENQIIRYWVDAL